MNIKNCKIIKKNIENSIKLFFMPCFFASILVLMFLSNYLNIYIFYILSSVILYFNAIFFVDLKRLQNFNRSKKFLKRKPSFKVSAEETKKTDEFFSLSLKDIFSYSRFYGKDDYHSIPIIRCKEFTKNTMTRFFLMHEISEKIRRSIIDKLDRTNISKIESINKYDHVLVWDENGNNVIYTKSDLVDHDDIIRSNCLVTL